MPVIPFYSQARRFAVCSLLADGKLKSLVSAKTDSHYFSGKFDKSGNIADFEGRNVQKGRDIFIKSPKSIANYAEKSILESTSFIEAIRHEGLL